MGAEVRRMQPEAQECPESAAGWGRQGQPLEPAQGA